MWLHFMLTCLICLVVLYCPSYFALRALGIDRIKAIFYAPLASFTIVSVFGILFVKLNIPSNGYTIGTALCLLCLLSYCISIIARKNRTKFEVQDLYTGKYYLLLLIYIAFGCITTLYMYVLPLDGPNSFVQTYDNVFHYNIIESFIQSEQWSFLQVDAYLASDALAVDPLPGSSFYPAGWHSLTALIASMLNVSVPLAANSVNAILIAIVFPVGIFSLLLAIFGKKTQILVVGAICAMVVPVFPWSLYNQWPLFPNAASLCLTPLVASCFIEGTNILVHRKTISIPIFITFAFGLFSLTVLQPNSIFTLIIFLAPFCIWKIYFLPQNLKHPHTPFGRLILLAAFILFVFLLFIVFFNLPFLQSTINYYWPPIMTTSQAILSVLDFSLTLNQPQWHISFLIMIGIIFILLKDRKSAWLPISYVIAAIAFIIAASDENTFLKHFLSGYWYTDPYRIAAFLGVFSIPIVSFGLTSLITLIQKKIEKLFSESPRKNNIKIFSAAILLVILPTISFVPISPLANAMNYLKNNAVALNLSEWNYLDSEELEFINKIKSIIPDNALIINNPYDGSMYAYGITELNLYYRDISGYGSRSETKESALIRSELNQISSNQSVKQAVKTIDAKYVLLLKPDFYSQDLSYDTYEADSWIGIESINEDTPGFTLMYEEGDMKLLKIE